MPCAGVECEVSASDEAGSLLYHNKLVILTSFRSMFEHFIFSLISHKTFGRLVLI